MTVQAYQALYDQELIAAFERDGGGALRKTCTTRGVVKGNTFVFDINSSGSTAATAVTRGINGDIPTRANDNTQVTLTLQEWHDIPEVSGFVDFASQGNQRAALQDRSVPVINRKVDDLIIAALGDATLDTGASATTLSTQAVIHALVGLARNDVPMGNDIHGLITPAGWGYLIQNDELTSADYVDNKMLPNAPMMFRWAGVNWQVHNALPGVGTSAEKCFIYHRNSIGWGMDTAGIKSMVGYDEKNDKSWARTSIFGGAKLLQNTGVVYINHDGSSFAVS